MIIIQTTDLPRGYLSFSGWKLWKQSPEAYFKKYILEEAERTSYEMALGKKFAEARELINGIHGEVAIECFTTKGIKLFGKCDFFDGQKIIDDKTSKNFKNIHKRSEEQILFYQLIIYRSTGKIVNGEIHHYQTRDDMAILLGEEEIDAKPTVYPCKKPTVAQLNKLEKEIEKDVINIIEYIKWKKKKLNLK